MAPVDHRSADNGTAVTVPLIGSDPLSPVDLHSQAFSREHVFHRQQPDSPAVLESVCHEVHTPLLIRVARPRRGDPELAGPLASTLHPHLERLLAV